MKGAQPHGFSIQQKRVLNRCQTSVSAHEAPDQCLGPRAKEGGTEFHAHAILDEDHSEGLKGAKLYPLPSLGFGGKNMEQSYGIGITNRFDLFLDEGDDPLEVLKIQEQEKEAKKKTKVSEKENKGKPETKAKPAPNERKGIKETSNVKTPSVGKPKEGMSFCSSARFESMFVEP